MNVLIDIGHPAHVHLFKNFIKLGKAKHNIYVTVRDIPSAKYLLEKYGINYIDIGSKSDSLAGKAFKQLVYNKKLFDIVRKKKIDLSLGTSMTIAHVSRITRMKSIIFDDDDDDIQPLFVRFAHPFADFLISPDALKYQRLKRKHRVYPGYHELAYLHPLRFEPDPSVLALAGLKMGERYFIVRLNAFKAHHDSRIRGLDLLQKKKIIDILSGYGRVFITVERAIEDEFKKYQLKIPAEKIHSFMYYAEMLVGDSQTMTSEAAVLGVPALKCNSFAGKLSIPNQLETKYKLCFSYLPADFPKMVKKVKNLAEDPDAKNKWQAKKKAMLKDKIDVTAFILGMVDEFPASMDKMLEDKNIFAKFENSELS